MKYKILILLLSLVVFVGCKSSKGLTTQPHKAQNPSAEVIQKVLATQPQFNTATVSKLAIKLNVNSRELNAMASCKIKKDSLIHLSILFLGAEVFKAELSTDSILLYDKMSYTCYAADYELLSERFGVSVDFYSIQNLLFNQLFCVGNKTLQPDSCRLLPLANGRTSIEYRNRNITQNTDITSLFQIEKVKLAVKDSPYLLNVKYADFVTENTISYPKLIDMQLSGQRSTAALQFSILKVIFNSPVKFSTTNPKGYSRSDISQVLRKQ